MSDWSGQQPSRGDAFGDALRARLDGREAEIVIERDDGLIDTDRSDYFSPPQGSAWEWITGRLGQRILDIGCGAGRGALAMAALGKQVVGLDVSPGAIEVCRRRGVAETFLGTVAELAATSPAPFDSFVCLGNNLGLLSSPHEAARFLDALRAISRQGSSLVGTMLNPYVGADPVHLAYHEANRRAGRLGGQVQIRVRYQRVSTAGFGLLWCSPDELAQVVGAAGWTVVDLLPGPIYAAEIQAQAG